MTKLGLCITGSFCTFKSILDAVDDLIAHGYDVTPIFSYNVSTLDTRFFKQADFERIIVEKTGKQPIKTIPDAEPLGTSKALDVMLVAPCTGNTLAKIAHGITDTPVTLAVKAHLRNNRPVVIFVSTNDALGANAKNIGLLLNTKNIYFVPFGQDAPLKKPNSLVADFSQIVPTLAEALNGKQIQPVITPSNAEV
ncbi:MAG: dipicolinate synthase subunit B [Bacteroides sp.]|nr:dipicolinate synthase subunit B [Bacillota bacterium]MCM1393690.1 dipicolinate synthase subunit B [[Eubacterium] siraeum]MCM1455211.1 dipicolinate synthase subunit B [Bacteroides sp.]